MNREEREKVTRKQYLSYISGKTLQQIASEYHLTHPGVIYRFRHYIHDDYRKLARGGVCAEISRYLNNPKLSDRKRNEISNWLELNLETILNTDSQQGFDFLPEKKLNQQTRSETGSTRDWANFAICNN